MAGALISHGRRSLLRFRVGGERIYSDQPATASWHVSIKKGGNINNQECEMFALIDSIRKCNLNCYRERYLSPLTTRNRTISINELSKGKPLVDDWRNQKVLFISQAPSRQAWADNELSSLDNNFFSDFLLPKVFPGLPLNKAFEIWKSMVFWMHTANCYPFVFTEGRNKGRDRLPNLKCANRYLDRIINTMKPQLIILMGSTATKFFAKSLRTLINNKKPYPSLEETLDWQKANQTALSIVSKSGISKYKAVAIPHSANWGKLSDTARFAYELAFRLVRDLEQRLSMKEKYYKLILGKYRNKKRDFCELFQAILSIGDEIGLENALGYLERCVSEKRLAWLDERLDGIGRTGDAVEDGYRIFYEEYLGISVPKDGEVVDKTDNKMVMRWWNYCPVLEGCKKFGLDTRVVCKRAYHKPVQVFLSRINPRLKFDRNYDSIRPYTPYCEEIITLEE